ncbi:MAG TPA: penicillin-binding protein 1C [Thioalkalivibrio sp.]|nr:penicillin-binding protein 1C [Thioalkalivibrio sp.]
MKRRIMVGSAALLLVVGMALGLATWLALEPPPAQLVTAQGAKPRFVDRHGEVLTVTYDNRWNLHQQMALHAMPPFLVEAFVISEDRRFHAHGGVDWAARGHAAWQNLKAGGVVRGASTITEQAVRLLRPRPRTPWARWLEGFEAGALEERFSKAEILEFYLNQVPYGARRRGVAQAARHYFDRDLDALTRKEMLALVVLVRAPGAWDPYRHPGRLEGPVARLAARLHAADRLTAAEYARIQDAPLVFRTAPPLPVAAPEFVQHVQRAHGSAQPRRHTTLDARLQQVVQGVLDARLADLAARDVGHAAALVVNHETGEILAWVNARRVPADGLGLDAVLTPRQPGSTLKPFVYALALERGWTAATLIDDAPVSAWIGHGSHRYRNYSNTHYGPLRLREALGNSLNIPAVRAAQFVGVEALLARLRALGIESLSAHPDHYGDGLALGNGEVTLFELVGAYAALARRGERLPFTAVMDGPARDVAARPVIDPQAASLIGNILADPEARRLEFGGGSLLRLPVETALKTGTSSDYRDAWTLGFNHRYTVGVWMGNLDYRPMREVTGAIGPALALRAISAELNRFEETRPLWLSPRLRRLPICRDDGRAADGQCASADEWFLAGTSPAVRPAPVRLAPTLRLAEPSPGLMLAMDPRIPDGHEAFALSLVDGVRPQRTEWWVDGERAATTGAGVTRWPWPVSRGEHVAAARVWLADEATPTVTPEVRFFVK